MTASNIIPVDNLPPCSKDDLAVMDKVIEEVKKCPEVDILVEHFIHAGIYSRTCLIPAGCVIVGALIKIPTVVQVCGRCKVTVGSKAKFIDGFAVLRASAGRRQAFYAEEDTYVTMSFATKTTDVKEAEKEFTDEFELLTTNEGLKR